MAVLTGFLYFLNSITFILGAAALGVAIYARVEFSSGWETLISLDAIYLALAAGALMMLVSILGCVVSKPGTSKVLVFVYGLFVVCILAAQIAAAVLANEISGSFSIQPDLISSEIVDAATRTINNGILSSYTACCTGCTESTCNNPRYDNSTVANCANQTTTCTAVQACNPPVNTTCFSYGDDVTTELVPPVFIDVTVCTLLSRLTVNSTALVGLADTGACGGGDPAAYLENVSIYFSNVAYYAFIAFIVIAGLQALVVISVLSILCCGNQKDRN